LDTGFAGLLSFFLSDADGNPWPKAPRQMNANDIAEYIDARLGPMFDTSSPAKCSMLRFSF
jgi:hypothetical protein